MKRKQSEQPFKYGPYIIEYRETGTNLLVILKEKLTTFEQAQQRREALLAAGYSEPIIRKI